MKVILALFVVGLSLLGFADDPSGAVVFDAASVLQSSVAPLISGLVVSLGSLLVASSVIYLAFLGWRKYKEACYHIAAENHDIDWLAENDEWVRNNGFIPLDDMIWLNDDDDDVFAHSEGRLESWHDGIVCARYDDVLVGNYDDGDLPCDDGSGCCFSADCPYFDGDCCTIGRS